MHSLTHLGANYRNENLFTEPRAEAFFRMIAANPAFTDPAIHEAPLAKGDKRFFVTYRSASLERQFALLRQEADARADRAAEQAHEYQLWADPDTAGLYWVLNLHSQEVYETTAGGCNCPDAFFRGRKTGVLCKHVYLVRSQIEADAELGTREAAHLSNLAQPDYAAIRARMHEDFPAD